MRTVGTGALIDRSWLSDGFTRHCKKRCLRRIGKKNIKSNWDNLHIFRSAAVPCTSELMGSSLRGNVGKGEGNGKAILKRTFKREKQCNYQNKNAKLFGMYSLEKPSSKCCTLQLLPDQWMNGKPVQAV